MNNRAMYGKTPPLHFDKGQRVGSLVVLHCVGTSGSRRMWQVRCDCGRLFPVRGHDLRRGIAKCFACEAT